MPQLVDLSSAGSVGLGSDDAYAKLSYTADLGVSFCHGLNVGFELSALGEAGWSPDLTQFVKAVAEIEAGAEVSARLALQISPNIAEVVGLYATAAAYAKLFVRARLAAGLNLDAMLSTLESKMPPLLFRILESILDDADLAVGVEALAQVAVTARAELIAQGRLIPDGAHEAGFDFRVGAGAAFIYGYEVDVFLRSRLPRTEQALARIAGLLVEELAELVPVPDDNPALAKTRDITLRVFAAGLEATAALAGEKAGGLRAAHAPFEALTGALLGECIETGLEAAAEELRKEIDKIALRDGVLDDTEAKALDDLAALDDSADFATLTLATLSVVGALLPKDARDNVADVVLLALSLMVLTGDNNLSNMDLPAPVSTRATALAGRPVDRISDAETAQALLTSGGIDAALDFIRP